MWFRWSDPLNALVVAIFGGGFTFSFVGSVINPSTYANGWLQGIMVCFVWGYLGALGSIGIILNPRSPLAAWIAFVFAVTWAVIVVRRRRNVQSDDV
jgi:hypothetical protein